MSKIHPKGSVVEFISSELGVPKTSLHNGTSLFHDLGVAGDDGFELVVKFCEKFEVSYEGFDPVTYFGEEESGNIFAMVVEIVTKRHFFNTPRLTIGNLITSVDTGSLIVSE